MRHPELPKLMFSAAEVAEMIGMSHGWVLEQARYRRVPHVRFGRRVMFRPADVEVLTEQFAVEPAPEPEPVDAETALMQQRDLAAIGLSPRSLAIHLRSPGHKRPLRRPGGIER